MTAGGSAWDGERADGPAAHLPYGWPADQTGQPDQTNPYGYDPYDPHAPYQGTSYHGTTYQDAPYRDDPDQDSRYGQGRYGPPPGWPPRRRRRWRWLRRAVVAVVALVMLGAFAFGVLLLTTPSVGNALALARAQARTQHAVYPGPPVPARFAESLVATEDHRFYSEPGVDVFAFARAAAAWATGNGDVGGASIDQQLAKMLYTPGRSGVHVAPEQIALAVKLYLTYSHAQILRMYADVAYFGHGYYGLPAASCGYFGTGPAGLSWPEAATLAGLVQGPSADDPIAHHARARARELHVLGRLVATHVISQAQADAAYSRGLHLVGGSGSGCPGSR